MPTFFHRTRSGVRAALQLEALESREVPATFAVTTLNDENDPADGQLSLREAIIGVNASADATNTITFASGLNGTINVGTGGAGATTLPAITKTVTITGPGANVLTVKDNINNSYALSIAAGAGTLVTISGLTISGNLTGNSGGIINTTSTLTLTGVELTGNSNANDGGSLVMQGGILNLTNSTIAGNQCGTMATGRNGGGMTVTGGTVNIDQCTIGNNTAVRSGAGNGNGGGINIAGGTVRIRNSTISGNNAGGDGGGLNIAAAATVTLSSTIVAANVGALSGNNDINGAVSVTSNNNLIGSPTGLTTTLTGVNSNQVGTTAMSINPMLGNLSNNGGPTRTFLPQTGSPAIDKGVDNGFTTDQRGFGPRVVGAAADVGSVEVGATASGIIGGPMANPDTATTTAGVAVTIDVLANDVGLTRVASVTTPSNGTAVISNNRVVYTPNAGFTGTDTFRYTATDANGANPQSAQVTVTVNPSGGGGQQDLRPVINQLVIANFQRIFAQPLPPALAFAMIAQIADVDGDGFADITCLIGVKAGKKVQVFKIVFDGLSPSGATIGGIQVLGTF